MRFLNFLLSQSSFIFNDVVCWEREVIGLLSLRGTFRANKRIISGLVGLSKHQDPPSLPALDNLVSTPLVTVASHKVTGSTCYGQSEQTKPLNKHWHWFNDVCTHCKKAMIFWTDWQRVGLRKPLSWGNNTDATRSFCKQRNDCTFYPVQWGWEIIPVSETPIQP